MWANRIICVTKTGIIRMKRIEAEDGSLPQNTTPLFKCSIGSNAKIDVKAEYIVLNTPPMLIAAYCKYPVISKITVARVTVLKNVLLLIKCVRP